MVPATAVLSAGASIAGSALRSTPSTARADGGFLHGFTDHSGWTVNIAGDGIGAATPWGALSLAALGLGLFMVARWTAKKL